MRGRPVDVVNDPKVTRRTVYGLVDRQSLPAVFRAFDFASPDLSSECRPRTTVPQQALFSMNAPVVIELARALAARPEVTAATSPEARIIALYRRALARPPDPPRLRPALRFVSPGQCCSKDSHDRSLLDPINNLPRSCS